MQQTATIIAFRANYFVVESPHMNMQKILQGSSPATQPLVTVGNKQM